MAITDAATGAQTWAARIAQAEVAVNQSVHDAVLEPELLLFIPVPIDLGVKVVAVHALRAGFEIVAYVPGQVWARDQSQQFRHWAVQPGGRDDVDPPAAGKYGPASAIRGAAEGIKDHPFPEWRIAALCGGHHNGAALGVQNLGTQFTAEVPRAEIRRRDRKERGRAQALESAFPVGEEKQLVFLDGPPMLPPSMFRMPFGLILTPARFSSHV